MKIPKKSGVYALKAINSKLLYIGSSKDLQARRNVHMSSIYKAKKNHGVAAMIDAFHDKEDTILFEVIELTGDYLTREQYWIDFYRYQDGYTLVNQFDAIRENSSVTEDFRSKMSEELKTRWKDPFYRKMKLDSMKATMFTPERLNKEVHIFTSEGKYLDTLKSAKRAAELYDLHQTGVAAAARGAFGNKFLYRGYLFIYDGVLDKLDELLETHQELRAISSEAWEACNCTKNVQRLMSE